ncbi:hypothetical protein ACFL2U_03195 [Patescibacteria group bacterium]
MEGFEGLRLICIEELGVSEEVETALRRAGIISIGQLESKKKLEEKGIPEEKISSICMALQQYGAFLPAS